MLVGGRRAREALVSRRARRRASGSRTTPSASRRSRSTRPTTACPTEQMVQGWADRTPDGFVMHVKAFGLMTRHPVKLEQVPPELREGLPVDAPRPRRPAAARARAARVPRVPRRARAAARERASSAGILFQMPPYVVWKPSSLDYLEWARDQVGDDGFLFEPRHRSWFAEDIRAELLRWLEERRMSWVVVDAPKVDAANVPDTLVADDDADRVRPLPRPQRRHVERRAAARPRSASTTSTARTSCASGCRRCASSPSRRRRRTRSSTTTTRRTASRRRRPARCCCASCSRRRTCRPLMRVLAVIHGPTSAPSCSREVLAEDGHELVEWDIRTQGTPPRRLRRGDGVRRRPERRRGGRASVAARGVRRAARAGSTTARRCSASASARRRSRTRSARRSRRVAERARRLLRDELTDAGVADPVLGVLPRRFEALNANGVRVRRSAGRDAELAERPGAAGVPGRRARVGACSSIRRSAATRCSTWFRGRADAAEAARASSQRELDEKLDEWQELGRQLCRAFLAAAELALDRQVVVARPLVPRADVVARVVAERAQHLRRDRRARAAVAVRDDLARPARRRARASISSGSSSISW